ncbi:hypothetical protein, partial [Endozoicomonas sp. ONNA2]|uniref:hypothetical protein n=1 Tax=Endozoicomonas sp. ONNA2 TaxID=2828741 RepID=UPI0021484EC7
MTSFILDNSVSMRWLSETSKKKDQAYAESVLKSFSHSDALVPNLWHLEVVNVTLGLEKQGDRIGLTIVPIKANLN